MESCGSRPISTEQEISDHLFRLSGTFLRICLYRIRLDDSYNMKLAQLGFIVVSMGHRGGSPMRGKFYHRYGYGNLRDYPLADDKYAIEQLADRYPFIDITKVGIFGHSGGGFMSTAPSVPILIFTKQRFLLREITIIMSIITVGSRFITG